MTARMLMAVRVPKGRVPVPRDILLARRAKKHGAQQSLRIIREARAAGLPISMAFALCEKESDFRNVFGHDKGGMYHGQQVTPERVGHMLREVAKGQVSNGVGFTQLTSEGFIRQAEKLGGAHVVKYQLRVAFKLLAYLIGKHGPVKGCAAYNAGEGGWRNGMGYSQDLRSKQDIWHKRLAKGS
jgi:hypothetical protein